MKKRPFLKWAGNKYQILNTLLPLLPKGKRLIEPFVGSGAVFLNSEFKEYFLSDTNPDLISLYQYLQQEGEAFIKYCGKFFKSANNCQERYIHLRQKFNDSSDQRLRAALFIYLNRHCYNGLCRYNASGIFNVPFGRYTKPRLPEEAMRTFLGKASLSVFKNLDFVKVMQEEVRKGDIVYCDPPYVPLTATASFTSYSANKFNAEEQIELAKAAEQLAKRKIPVIISNHDTPFTREIYVQASIISFPVPRHISSDIKNRNKVQELLAIYLP